MERGGVRDRGVGLGRRRSGDPMGESCHLILCGRSAGVGPGQGMQDAWACRRGRRDDSVAPHLVGLRRTWAFSGGYRAQSGLK